MKTLRVFFSKDGRTKYISHLDLVRVLTRAFARTSIPVWFTEGFNPRMYMSFSLPLSLGVVGREESFDFRLTDEAFSFAKVKEELNRVLPQGLEVLAVAEPAAGPEAVAWADYRLSLTPEGGDANALAEGLRTFLTAEEVITTKTTKRGKKEIDLAPLMELLSLEAGEGAVCLSLRLAAGSTLNISPSLVLEAFEKGTGIAIAHRQAERTAVRNADLTLFR